MDAYMFPLFIVLQVLDAAVTYKGLKGVDVREGNPVVAFFIKKLGLAGGLLAVKALVVSFVYFGIEYSDIDPKLSLIVLNAIYVAILINNIVQLRK